MSNLTLKFDDDNSWEGLRKHTMGCYKGNWVLRINGHEFVAPTREEVSEKVIDFIRKALSRTRHCVAHVNGELTVLHETSFGVERFSCTIDKDGILKQRGGSFSSEQLEKDAQSALMHMAQQDWSLQCSDEPPAYLTDEQAKDFIRWTRWQREYANHIAQGCDANEAHRLACGF